MLISVCAPGNTPSGSGCDPCVVGKYKNSTSSDPCDSCDTVSQTTNGTESVSLHDCGKILLLPFCHLKNINPLTPLKSATFFPTKNSGDPPSHPHKRTEDISPYIDNILSPFWKKNSGLPSWTSQPWKRFIGGVIWIICNIVIIFSV